MNTIIYRPFTSTDGDAVFVVAQAAWQFTYATIFDATFIEQFVRTNYAPARLNALAPLVAAQQIFFDVAVDGEEIIGSTCIPQPSGKGLAQPCSSAANSLSAPTVA